MNQEEQLCPNDLVLLQLGRRLLADGYRFTTPTPLTHQRVNQRDEGQMADSLRDVFGWSRPFAPGLLSADEQRHAAAEVEPRRIDGERGGALALGEIVRDQRIGGRARGRFADADAHARRYQRALDAASEAHFERTAGLDDFFVSDNFAPQNLAPAGNLAPVTLTGGLAPDTLRVL